jgi:hypothetical protein
LALDDSYDCFFVKCLFGFDFQLFDVDYPVKRNQGLYGPAEYGMDRGTRRVLREYLAHGGVLGPANRDSSQSASAAETAQLQSQLGARAAAKLSDPETDAALKEYQHYAGEAAAALKWHSEQMGERNPQSPQMSDDDQVTDQNLSVPCR